MEAVDALIPACKDFEGGLIVISHNRHFLSSVCNELVVVTKGTVSKYSRHNNNNNSNNNSNVKVVGTNIASKKLVTTGKSTTDASGVIMGEETFDDLLNDYLEQIKKKK